MGNRSNAMSIVRDILIRAGVCAEEKTGIAPTKPATLQVTMRNAWN